MDEDSDFNNNNQSEGPTGVAKRKLINKVHKKNKRRNERLIQSFENTHLKIKGQNQNQGMASLLEGAQSMEIDMMNHISQGQNRKMKKKMKKLKKKNLPDDKILKEMTKAKEQFHKGNEKKLFNPANEMEKRRQKRAKQR